MRNIVLGGVSTSMLVMVLSLSTTYGVDGIVRSKKISMSQAKDELERTGLLCPQEDEGVLVHNAADWVRGPQT